MPSKRPNLTMDEQSFQGLLSAAFTIQEHNDRQREPETLKAEAETPPQQPVRSTCPHCGAPKDAQASRCDSCEPDELRPGERLQRNWASMWLMSQQQGLFPERSSDSGSTNPKVQTATRTNTPAIPAERTPSAPSNDFSASNFLAPPEIKTVTREVTGPQEVAAPLDRSRRPSIPLNTAGKNNWTVASSAPQAAEVKVNGNKAAGNGSTAEPSYSTGTPFSFSANTHSATDGMLIDAEADGVTTDNTTLSNTEAIQAETTSDDLGDDRAPTLVQRLTGRSVTLRFQRADLYLGVSVFVAVAALLWPAADAPHRPTLSPWDRALITLGIAEAPTVPVHPQGDPGLNVWVDPHTALYYCPGEEQYGKTRDGHLSSQREAQMDSFEPAGRSACE